MERRLTGEARNPTMTETQDLGSIPPIARKTLHDEVVDLGPAGPPWHPTSSVRTLYQPEADVFVKTSLSVRITNCMRHSTAAELEKAVRLTRLLTPLLAGVDALTTGQGRGVVTLGQLVSTTAGIAGITLVAAALYRAGRRVRPDWRFGLAGAVGVGVTALPQLFWTRPVLRASGWLLVGIGLLLVTLAWWPLVSGWLFADRATGPAAAGESSQARRRLLRVVRWSLPVALLCAVLLALLIGDTGLVVG